MKLIKSTVINLPPETVWQHVQTPQLLIHIAWPMIGFAPIGDQQLEAFKPGGTYQVKLRLLGFIPIGTQWIVTSTHLNKSGDWPKRLRDNGHSALISKWDHWITIEPDARGGTRYQDAIDIEAGALTPFVWAFAHAFYSHRQRRWREFARTFRPRQLVALEMRDYLTARGANQIEHAWKALERAHIVSQPYLGPHITVHLAMLDFAWGQRDRREIVGQVFRLMLAPIGALLGRIPIGNTGRSNVNAFKPMAIPEDLLVQMTRKDD